MKPPMYPVSCPVQPPPVERSGAPRWVGWMVLLAVLAALAACSPRQLLVRGVADELASQGQADEEDLGLARDASPFYLKLSESLLKESPGHQQLAQAVASGFTQYAYAFVAFEAERMAATDAKAAHTQNERARRLYLRAHHHAMAALEWSDPGFKARLLRAQAAESGVLKPDQVGLAYWAAASWGASIALSKDDADAVADLPAVVRLATWAWNTSPSHGQGALASLMGTLEAARPGGSAPMAAAYFDQAIALGGGRSAAPYVAKAESIALPAGDRPTFEALLRAALAASAARRDMSNQVMQARAEWLLGQADDLF
ncbi:MAG: TRAP transporter TatT component family protein [Burkholderiaceae bacterium]|nr:TRAP transporter TatT component family protein [Burkholderiaceae bacterium]